MRTICWSASGAKATRDRDDLCTHLRARAERAERQVDAHRDELTQLHADTGRDVGTRTGG
jgi:hypothetical protein